MQNWSINQWSKLQLTDFASVAIEDENLEKVYLSKKVNKEEVKVGASITTDQTSLFNGNSKMVI